MTNVGSTNLTIWKSALICGVFLTVIALLGVPGAQSVAREPQIDFSVSTHSIRLGESTTLSWEIRGASQAFLSYIGTVGSIGSVVVRPERTTTYALLADASSGLIARSVTVEVARSGRGDEFPLNMEDFKYPLTATTKTGFAELAGQVHSVLQDGMHLSVKKMEYDPDHARLAFVTSRG